MKDDSAVWYKKLDNLIFSLAKIYKQNFEQTDRTPHNVKLSGHELGVLQILEWEPDASVSMIAEYLDIPRSTLTSTINRMEKKNILFRKKDSEDKRVIKLVFTEKGRKLHLLRKEGKKDMFKYIYHALENDSDRKTFLTLLNKISDEKNFTAEYRVKK